MKEIRRGLTGLSLRPARGVLVLMVGVGGSQALSFLAMPLLAKLYLPDAFGQLALFVSIVGVVGVLATGRMELAIPLARSDDCATRELALGLLVVAVVSLVSGIGCGVYLKFAGDSTPAALLRDIWWFIPFAVLATGVWRVLNYWHTRLKSFGVIASSYMGRAAVLIVAQVALALLFVPRGPQLVLGNTLGIIAAVCVLLHPLISGPGAVRIGEVTRSDLLASVRENRNFLLYGSGQAVTNALSQHAMILVMSGLFMPGVLGQISMAMKLLMFPVHLVAEAVRRVLYQRLTSEDDAVERVRLWKQTTLGLTGLGMLMAGVILSVGPWLFVHVLGKEWSDAGQFARILVWPAVFALINPPSTMTIPLLGLQAIHFRYELLLLVFRVAALLIGAELGGVAGCLWGYAVVSILMNGWLMMLARTRLGRAVKLGP